jgi:hypothetical protein
MPDPALTELMSELARLLSDRSATPRKRAIAVAHAKIRALAASTSSDEEWCDRVLLLFLARRHQLVAA